MTDAQLIQASIQGDDNAFKMLVRRYESVVALTVFNMIGQGQEAEDVGQETFIRLYKSLHCFRGESSLSTYVIRIAMNLSLNALKRRKRSRSRFGASTQEIEIADGNSHEYNDDHEIIRKAVQRLSPEFRSVVVLRFFKELSIKEISDILKIPQGTVLSRLARAQKKLKRFLEPILGEHNERKDVQSAAQVV